MTSKVGGVAYENVFERLKLKSIPDKTFIGGLLKALTFLATKTPMVKFLFLNRRFLFIAVDTHGHHPDRATFLDAYRQRWLTWIYAGIE